MTNDFAIGFVVGISTILLTSFVFIWANRPVKVQNVNTQEGLDNEPISINEDNPPRWMNYSPNDINHKAYCGCHAQRLVPGQRVLLWPATKDTSPKFFCQEGVGEVLSQ
jgi:hypothetical protein